MDLIKDIESNTELLDKLRTNDDYAQNLYAAMCNNDFVKLDPWLILNDKFWSCSWRAAGRFVAELRDCGEDYMDFYCTGLAGVIGFQTEGKVTREILDDLNKIGWTINKPDIADS